MPPPFLGELDRMEKEQQMNWTYSWTAIQVLCSISLQQQEILELVSYRERLACIRIVLSLVIYHAFLIELLISCQGQM
jgi:hypothetical protein